MRLVIATLAAALFAAACDETPQPSGAIGVDEANGEAREEIVVALKRVPNIIDLSYTYDENTLYWPTSELFEKKTVFEGETEGGYYYSAYWIATAEHGGTHLDAPIHFYEGGVSADEIPLKRLSAMGFVIDVSEEINGFPDALITVQMLDSVLDYSPEMKDAIILIRTGWGNRWPDAKSYLGTEKRGEEGAAELHFPGLSEEAARWLVQKDIAAVGIDTASIDRGQSKLFRAHQELGRAGIPIFENVANLHELKNLAPLKITALPMKIGGGSGAPLRIIASPIQDD